MAYKAMQDKSRRGTDAIRWGREQRPALRGGTLAEHGQGSDMRQAHPYTEEITRPVSVPRCLLRHCVHNIRAGGDNVPASRLVPVSAIAGQPPEQAGSSRPGMSMLSILNCQ